MIKFKVCALIVVLFWGSAAAFQVTFEDKEIYKSMDLLAEILVKVKNHVPEEVKGEVLMEGAIKGLLDQLDPHSTYYNKNRYTTMQEDHSGSFYGIGVTIGNQNGKLSVVSVHSGGPGSEAGLKPGDVISEVEGKDTSSMLSGAAIRLLRGEEGTTVNIKVQRPNVEEPIAMSIARQHIPSSDVRAYYMADPETGYVALKEFGDNAARDVRNSLVELEKQGMKQLVLDLRGNPGGLLPQAIELVSLFIPENKTVVSTKGRLPTSNKKYYSESESAYKDLPLVVLIDRGSASASEIVAGAIQDHDRGLLLGTSSWGKGLVQSVFPISNGETGLALTTSRYYTPSGRNIQGNYERLEDYYNPESSEDLFFSPDMSELPVFKTTHGRKLHEARGISPDIYLRYKETHDVVSDLDRQDAYFNYIVEHSELLPTLDGDFRVDETRLADFKAWLVEKEISVEHFDEGAEDIARKLSMEFLYMSSSKQNEQWAWRAAAGSDLHVQSALDVFDQAKTLLRVFQGTEVLPQNYEKELKEYSRLRSPGKIEETVPSGM